MEETFCVFFSKKYTQIVIDDRLYNGCMHRVLWKQERHLSLTYGKNSRNISQGLTFKLSLKEYQVNWDRVSE